MKVVFVDNKPVYAMNTEIQRAVCQSYGFEYVTLDCRSEEEVIEKCRDADAILDVYFPLTPRIIQSLERCKVLVRFGIGYDCIDVEAATQKGIFVCNVPDYCIEEVATHTVALILDLCRKTCFYHNEVKEGRWKNASGYPVHRLSTQTVGFWGFGHIARQAARYLSAFGCRILAHDPFLPDEIFAQQGVERVSLEALLASADILSLHAPLTEQTHHQVNRESIAKMKDGVMLVNTSRGPLICEEDLLEGIASGKITAAALDVVEFEPIQVPHYRLFTSGRITVTPHAAFASAESRVELLQKVAQSACAVLAGEFNDTTLRRIVNRQALRHQINGQGGPTA